MLAPPDSTALDRSLSAGPATCGGSAASPAGAVACGERAGAPWRWAPTRQRCSRGGPPTWRCVQQWQVQVSSRGRSLCLAHLPATAPPAKPRILAPRTPRSRPSSSALVFDSASASAHTTCLAARDTTGARSAGRVHAGPESAASRLIASASMLECCVRSLIAMQCNRPITGGIIRERSARRSQTFRLLTQTIICMVHSHNSPVHPWSCVHMGTLQASGSTLSSTLQSGPRGAPEQ
jgi:hypothetical protein